MCFRINHAITGFLGRDHKSDNPVLRWWASPAGKEVSLSRRIQAGICDLNHEPCMLLEDADVDV